MSAEIIAGVFGKPDDTDYVFLIPHPIEAREISYAVHHGLEFCGTMAFVNGESAARCEPNEKAVLTMMAAVPAFALYVRSQFQPGEPVNEFATSLSN